MHETCAVNRREEKSININKFELLVIIVMMTGSMILVLWKLMDDTHSCFVQFQEIFINSARLCLQGTNLRGIHMGLVQLSEHG